MYKKIFIFSFLILNCLTATSQLSKIEEIRIKLDTTKSDSLKIHHFLDLAREYYALDPKKSLEYNTEALKIAEKINHELAIIESNLQIGYSYSVLNNFYLAIDYYKKTKKLISGLKYNILDISLSLNIANAYYALAEYSEALSYAQDIIKASDSINYNTGKADAYVTIGIIYGQEENLEQAIKHYELAADIYRSTKDSIGLGLCFNNIGDEYIRKGKYELAIKEFNKALRCYNSSNYEGGKMHVYHNLGITNAKLGRTKIAREYFQQAEELYKKYFIKFDLSELYKDMADFYYDIKNYPQAIFYGEKSLELAKEVNAKKNIRNASMALAKYYADVKDFKRAYKSHIIFKNYDDSLMNEEKSRHFLEVESKYKIKQNEEELKFQKELLIRNKQQLKIQRIFSVVTLVSLILISLFGISWFLSRRKLKSAYNDLTEKNEKIEKQRFELQELNHTKDKLFSIISHDLRNSIGSVYNFIEILLNSPDYSDTENIKYILGTLEKSFGATYNLLENLLYWAKSQQNRIQLNFEKQTINDIIQENIHLFSAAAEQKGIELSTSIEQPIYAYFDKNSVNLVLRNLISNAIKFTESTGKITISAVSTINSVEVSISDTGKGISQSIIDKIFSDHFFYSSPGTMEESGSGLGLKLCKEFITRNKGSIRVVSEPEQGSIFIFSLPTQPV